ARMVNFWAGPFLNPVRVYKGTSGSNDPADLTQQDVSWDIILDPWGNHYRFYSPRGLVSSSNSVNAQLGSGPAYLLDDGVLGTADNRFERFAIVSYGSNALPDSSTAVDDDIYYEFGFSANESSFNIF